MVKGFSWEEFPVKINKENMNGYREDQFVSFEFSLLLIM